MGRIRTHATFCLHSNYGLKNNRNKVSYQNLKFEILRDQKVMI